MKIFQIGFNKCGTHSLHSFFHNNGLASIHWGEGKLAPAMFTNLQEGRPLLQGYEDYDAFTDMEFIARDYALEAFKLFPYIAGDYPDALFILNTRDREAWVKSRFRHNKGKLARKWKVIYGVETDEDLARKWCEDWDRHHQRAIDFFANRSHRFVVFNIEQDSPEVLAQALPEHKLDVKMFRHKAKSPAPAPRLELA